MTDDAELAKLLRYVSGELSPKEASEFRVQLEHDPDLRAQVEAWQRVRQAQLPTWNTEQTLMTLQGELGFGKRRSAIRVVPFPERPVSVKRRATQYAARIAAVLLVGAGVAMVWRMGSMQHSGGSVVAPLALQEYSSPRGRRVTVRLADGTQVVLAAETRLLVPRDFGRRGMRREMRLEGQASFDVTHDESRPFVVRTATSVTEDLGTVFTIRAYPTESEVEVVVAKGSVAIQPSSAASHDSPRVLGSGEIARLDTKGDLQVGHVTDLSRYFAWTKGHLAFDDVPFRRAAADVARWYDLDVQLADSALGARRVSGVMVGESAEAVLGYLAVVLDARYELHGRAVTFYPRRSVP